MLKFTLLFLLFYSNKGLEINAAATAAEEDEAIKPQGVLVVISLYKLIASQDSDPGSWVH
jgi:hypothetical protein